jgi:Family of unknown function (DUF5518)
MGYDNLINEYTREVTKDMDPKKGDEVAEELKTHILDSAEALATERNVEIDENIISEVISKMGPAKDLSKMYPKSFDKKVAEVVRVNLNLNWKAIIFAFIFTFAISIFSGLYLPQYVVFISPVIGGLIAGYMVGGNYSDGIVNAGIATSIAGLISLTTILLLDWSFVSTTLNNYGYNIPPEQLFISLVLGAALIGLVVYFILGSIGGIIGSTIKGRKSNQKMVLK